MTWVDQPVTDGRESAEDAPLPEPGAGLVGMMSDSGGRRDGKRAAADAKPRAADRRMTGVLAIFVDASADPSR